MTAKLSIIDFPTLADRLLADAPTLLRQWLPAGKIRGREYVCGNVRGDAGDSLNINIDKGCWIDHATSESGGDLISLYAAIHNIKQSEAAKELGGGTVTQEDTFITGQTCHPLPKHKHGKPTAVFEYKNSQGELYGYICRFDVLNEGKQFAPLTCWQNADGKYIWKWKKWPIDSLPYRIEHLTPVAKVLIVEGEKKADHAQKLLPEDWIVLGWCGGAEAVKKTNWQLLQTRYCWIWPDNDAPGIKAAQVLKRILPDLHIVQLPEGLPIGWDLGDSPDNFYIVKYLENKSVALTPIDEPSVVIDKSVIEDTKSILQKALKTINSQYAVIVRGSQVLIMRHWFDSEGNGKLIFLSRRDFLLYMENKRIEIESGNTKRIINVGKTWLEWEERQSFEEVYFEPAGEERLNCYNLWRGFTYKTPCADAGKFDLLLAHIKDNICHGNEEHYIWVMSWLADLFQKPAHKLGTALVLRGKMGIGKGAFAFHIGHLLNVHFMPITQSSQLTGKFNGHMADKVLMFVDEGWWSDERMGQGILRALITEPEVTIELKGRDPVTFPNYTRFIIAANESWVVPVSADDERRFSILDVSDAHREDKPYFNAIKEQLTNIHIDEKGRKHIIDKSLPENGGYQGLLHYLLNYKYDVSIPSKILKTEALCENKIHSMPDEMKWWYECLSVEKIGDFKLVDKPKNDIQCEKFYDAYLNWCEIMRIRPLAKNILPKNLKPAVVNFNRKKQTVGNSQEQDWFYLLQAISDMRHYFQKYLGHEINWDEI